MRSFFTHLLLPTRYLSSRKEGHLELSLVQCSYEGKEEGVLSMMGEGQETRIRPGVVGRER